MVWRGLIADVLPNVVPASTTVSPIFYPPAQPEAVAELETVLGTALPGDLKSMLAETDGVAERMVWARYDEKIGYLLWPVERIRETNLRFRTDSFLPGYAPFDRLLFFADAGNGDQFAYTTLNGRVDRPDILAWDHEDDSRTWVAPSLKTFIVWWCEGRIKT